MRFLAIIALALLAGITYGILHDQVTARVCVEYFMADWWAHTASYFGGFAGSIVLCLWVWRSRRG